MSRIQRAVHAVQRNKPDPLTSLVLTLPVFLIYHLGILLIDMRNGVDWVTVLTFRLLDASVPAYVGVTLGLAVLLAGALWLLRRRGAVKPRELLPVLGESFVWAVVMLFSVGAAVRNLTPGLQVVLDAPGSTGSALGPLEKVVMAAGAGFHEEVAFRVLLFSGGARALVSLGARPLAAFALTALVSSLVFAFVHHLGVHGESITFAAFSFRTLAGLYLCGLYAARGFAVAVYTHALYDLLVFFVL
jgi:hypothetical protein